MTLIEGTPSRTAVASAKEWEKEISSFLLKIDEIKCVNFEIGELRKQALSDCIMTLRDKDISRLGIRQLRFNSLGRLTGAAALDEPRGWQNAIADQWSQE